MNNTKRILVFDSGVGGLSVVAALRQLPYQLDIQYLFDNAFFPFGEQPPDVLLARIVDVIQNAVAQLKPQLVVIACNTASTLALPALRQTLSLPVVGVVPAIKPAAAHSVSRHIGLLATPATVQREYIDALIGDFAADCKVSRIGSSALVKVAEAALCGQAYQLDVVANELAAWRNSTIDTVVLGCTHFPLMIEQLRPLLADHVRWVDSGNAIARRVAHLLSQQSSNEFPDLLSANVSYSTAEITKGYIECFPRFALVYQGALYK